MSFPDENEKFLYTNVGISDTEKIRSFTTPESVRQATNQQESKPTLQIIEHRSLYDFGYRSQSTTHKKKATAVFRQTLSQHNLPSLVKYKSTGPTEKLKPTMYNSSYLPTGQSNSGYSRPTSTITSQIYNNEQTQETKNKTAMFVGTESNRMSISNIKKEPTLSDDFVYEGSMESNGRFVNPNTNIKKIKDSPRSSFHDDCEQVVATPAYNHAGYKDRVTNTQHPRAASRPTVIRSLNMAKEPEQPFLRFEAEMLKFHGDLLKQTGK